MKITPFQYMRFGCMIAFMLFVIGCEYNLIFLRFIGWFTGAVSILYGMTNVKQ